MARCKECLHYDICAREGRMVQIDEHTWDDYNQLDDVEHLCDKYLAHADVAPKSEVAIEVLDEAIRAVYSKIDMKIYNTIEGKPLGDVVAFGKQQAMYDVITLLAELKKKYAEEKE